MQIEKTLENTPLKLLISWMQRIDSREKLKVLSDRSLKDIGLTRLEIQKEIHKPFWKA